MDLQELALLRGTCAVLFSGGWDSTYCLIRALNTERDVVAVFFDYGQPYLRQEQKSAQAIAQRLQVRKKEVTFWPRLANDSGAFEARNAVLLSLVAAARPRCIYFGSRNLLPLMDRYGDSNWLFARRASRVFGLPIKTPCTGRTKHSIIRRVVKSVSEDLIYSTEKGYTR